MLKRLLPVAVLSLLAVSAASSQPAESPLERLLRTGETQRASEVVDQFKVLEHNERLYALREAHRSLLLELLEIPADQLTWDDWEQNEEQGYARTLRREITGRMPIPGLDGGGSYFSFGERVNDYQSTADIGCEQGHFMSGFHGGCAGAVTRIDTGLRELTLDDVPAELRETHDANFTELSRHLRHVSNEYWRSRARVTSIEVGATYVVRSVHDAKRDLLVGVQVLSEDDFGVTFAWKILKRYPTPHRR